MKLQAQVVVNDYTFMAMDDDQLKDYVVHKLTSAISSEVVKNMTITKTVDPVNAQTIYTGSLTAPNSYVASNNTVSGFNGTSSARPYLQEFLRVVEYKKDGKITRVELQTFDGDDWHKVPRIQIDE